MSMPTDPRRLATTRWSRILAARDPSAPEADGTLATLCETYWAPVYDFVRYSSLASADDARELTQAFFTRVLGHNDFLNTGDEGGRFRSYLLTAVRSFLASQPDRGRGQKRGDKAHRSFESPGSPASSYESIDPGSTETPESIYERRWALATLETAMTRLGRQYDSTGRGELFRRLQSFIIGGADVAYASVASELEMTDVALHLAVQRLRGQFGESLREVLSETVGEPADVDAELQFLMGVLSRPAPARSLKES